MNASNLKQQQIQKEFTMMAKSKQTYEVVALCLNCRNKFRITLPKGSAISDEQCGYCGTKRLTGFESALEIKKREPVAQLPKKWWWFQ